MKMDCKFFICKIKKWWNRYGKKWGRRYGLYISIMLVSAFIRGIPISSGIFSLDETLNDIAIGTFTSTLVAWLILVQDQNQMKKRNEELREYTLSPLWEAIINYMQNFCRAIAVENNGMYSQKHTFSEWSSLYFSQLKESIESPIEKFHGMDTGFLNASLNRISEESKRILDNAVWFQKEGVLNKEECDLIYKIGALCEASKIFTVDKQSTLSVGIINSKLDSIIQQSGWANLATAKYSHNLSLEYYFMKRG